METITEVNEYLKNKITFLEFFVNRQYLTRKEKQRLNLEIANLEQVQRDIKNGTTYQNK